MTRPFGSVYGEPPTMRGPRKFASRTSTPLIALRYSASTVSTVLYGRRRSNPAEKPWNCGYLKSGSVLFTPTVPAAPAAGRACPAHDVGRLSMSTVNAGVSAPVQLRRTRPRPVFAYALPSRIYGGGPV